MKKTSMVLWIVLVILVVSTVVVIEKPKHDDYLARETYYKAIYEKAQDRDLLCILRTEEIAEIVKKNLGKENNLFTSEPNISSEKLSAIVSKEVSGSDYYKFTVEVDGEEYASDLHLDDSSYGLLDFQVGHVSVSIYFDQGYDRHNHITLKTGTDYYYDPALELKALQHGVKIMTRLHEKYASEIKDAGIRRVAVQEAEKLRRIDSFNKARADFAALGKK